MREITITVNERELAVLFEGLTNRVDHLDKLIVLSGIEARRYCNGSEAEEGYREDIANCRLHRRWANRLMNRLEVAVDEASTPPAKAKRSRPENGTVVGETARVSVWRGHTVPGGTPVSAWYTGTGELFFRVDWQPAGGSFGRWGIDVHDAIHYGVPVRAEDVILTKGVEL